MTQEILLSSERPKDYASLRKSVFASCAPDPGLQTLLLDDLIAAAWEVRRWRINSARFWDYVGGHYGRGNHGIAEALLHCPEKHFRAERGNRAEATHNYFRALDRWLQAARDAETRSEPKKAAASSGEWLLRLKELTDSIGDLCREGEPDNGSPIASDRMLSSS